MARGSPLLAIGVVVVAAAALTPAAAFDCKQGSVCDGLSGEQQPRCQEAQLTFYASCAELLAVPLGEPSPREICSRECREAAVAWQVRARPGSPSRGRPQLSSVTSPVGSSAAGVLLRAACSQRRDVRRCANLASAASSAHGTCLRSCRVGLLPAAQERDGAPQWCPNLSQGSNSELWRAALLRADPAARRVA